MFLLCGLYHVRLLYWHALILVTKTLKLEYQELLFLVTKDTEIEKARIISRNKDAEMIISRVINSHT